MKVAEIRDLTDEELELKIAEARREVMELRFQHAALKLESPVKLRIARRNLARLLTLQTESLRK
jgi:large subunit ribosomal protein L29